MDGKHKNSGEDTSLDQQMKDLLSKIEKEPVPGALQDLAQELQAAIQRRRESSDPQD